MKVQSGMRHEWSLWAINRIEADFLRSSDTHLIPLQLSGFPEIDFYFKDESSHPTGSLKHRLARSLFLYSLCNGWLDEKTTIVEASSGSTAISEAYFAQLLRLPFIAVMPKKTSPEKIAAIEFYGGKCHLVANPAQVYSESIRLAKKLDGHYMDQFTYAERATDWRANNNIAESIFSQMRAETYPVPHWLVAAAGTGGTTATLGRYVRYQRHHTRILCPDPVNSVFLDYFLTRDKKLKLSSASRIEGIGRPRVESSFLPDIIDAMVRVSDEQTMAALRFLEVKLGRRVGGSTGTNFVGMLVAASEMVKQKEKGSIVGILCDSGERYSQSYYNDEWIKAQRLDTHSKLEEIKLWALKGVRPKVPLLKVSKDA